LTGQLLTINFQHWAGRATLSSHGSQRLLPGTGNSTLLAVNEHYLNIGLLNAESPTAITETEPAAASAGLAPTREENTLVLGVVNTSAAGRSLPAEELSIYSLSGNKKTTMFERLHSLSKSRLPFRRPESVYFYTLHKCASSLFNDYVLKNVKRLRLVDYADRLNKGDPVECVTFKEKGFIYGPIRLSTGPPSATYSRLVEPASRRDFIRDKIAIFLIRDPRDILVSSYYSFGYTHGFSAVKEIEERQRRTRELIRRQTIDAFALEIANATLNHFRIVDRLSQACNRGIILKYEDMIDNWEKFSSGLTKYLDIGRKTLHHTYQLSRPLENESETGHRRSGKPGAYKHKLLTSTVDALNIIFASVLTRFHYQP